MPMPKKTEVNLTDLLFSLSQAMEIAHANLSNHQLRTAYIVWKMGVCAGLSVERLERMFVAASLHDIGAFSIEEKLHIHDFEMHNPASHCDRGALLFMQVPWLAPMATIVKHHHRTWYKCDAPLDAENVFESQMLLLADMLERRINRSRYILHQNQDIINHIYSLSGTAIHHDVVDIFTQISGSEEFWLDLTSPNILEILKKNGPFRHVSIEREKVFAISEIFRIIIDFRSPMTATHSCGVSSCAAVLGRLFGLTVRECQTLELAGNLHDLGKLVISDSILCKPGRLTTEEYAIMRQHTYVTYSVLSSVRGFEQITEYAAFHHEQLNGSGYPFHLLDTELGTGARIIAVADVFTALNEDRPYRGRMPQAELVETLQGFVSRNHLDALIVAMLMDNYDLVRKEMLEKQSIILNYYHEQFKLIE